jgi:hypothetical protein
LPADRRHHELQISVVVPMGKNPGDQVERATVQTVLLCREGDRYRLRLSCREIPDVTPTRPIYDRRKGVKRLQLSHDR